MSGGRDEGGLEETRLLKQILAALQVLIAHAERAEGHRVLEVHERFGTRLLKCERADQVVALWRRDRAWAGALPDHQRERLWKRCIRRVADIQKTSVEESAAWFREAVDTADMAGKAQPENSNRGGRS